MVYSAQHLALLKGVSLVVKYLQLHKEHKVAHRSSPLSTLFRFLNRCRAGIS